MKLRPDDPIFYGKPLVFTEGNHQYRWDGKVVPSVTGILGILNKPALVHWAANTAVEHLLAFPGDYEGAKKAHQTKKEDAGDVGKIVHKYAERLLGGKDVVLPDEVKARRGCMAFDDFAREHKLKPIALERRMMSLKHRYAGTTDFYGDVDGKRAILDFKTSSGMYDEFWYQTSAYEEALVEELYGEVSAAGKPIKAKKRPPMKRWLIHLDKKTGEFKPYVRDYDENHARAWFAIRACAQALKDCDAAASEARKAEKKAAKELPAAAE
jgi:hypothetical protein